MNLKGKIAFLSMFLLFSVLLGSPMFTANAVRPDIPKPKTLFRIECILDLSTMIFDGRMLNNINIYKIVQFYDITADNVDGTFVDGTLTLDYKMIKNVKKDQAVMFGSFEITTLGGEVIRGNFHGKITDFSGSAQIQGSFNGDGYMNVKGTLEMLAEYEMALEGYYWNMEP